MKKFCPKCQKDYLGFDNYCQDCGVLLRNRRLPKCPKCGSGVYGKFCGKCGLKFNERLLKKAKIIV